MNIAFARQVAMYICREITKSSLGAIGKHFGNRDHSTVIHACRNIENKMNDDKELKNKIDNMRGDFSG